MLKRLNLRASAAHYLFVDDDEVCIMAMKRALKKLDITDEVSTASNGLEALSVIEQSVRSDGTLPHFIITLDLNMPKMGGLEFLERIRAEPAYEKLVVFVLTSSDNDVDIEKAYQLGISGYIYKEHPMDSIIDSLQMIKTFSDVVVLPA